MAKTKIEQIRNAQAKTPEGWTFDAQQFIIWHAKELFTDSEPDESGAFYRIQLQYREETTGSGWMAKSTGRQLPTVHISRYTPTDETASMCSVVWIIDKEAGEPQKQRNFNYLLKLAPTLDTAALFAEARAKDTGASYNNLGMTLAEEAVQEQTNETTPEESDELTEALQVAEVLGNEAQVVEGMKFEDASGDVFTITKLDSMQVEFNGGERSLYDFGTTRTVGEVSHGLGNGAHLASAPQDAQTATENAETTTAEEEPEAPQETATGGAQTAETAATEEEPTEETETEQPEEAPENDKLDYNALAAAYFTGKTIKANKKPRKEEPTPEPEQTTTEDESEPQEPPKTAPGFTGEPSDILTEEEAERLNKGEQVRKDTESYSRIFTAARYTDRTALLYSIDEYKGRADAADPLKPGADFNYKGFITDNKTYINAEAIREEMRDDIAEELRRMIPDEETARANAESCEDWQRRTIENAEKYGANDAKNLFYKDETPQLYLYSHMENIKSVDLIRYIEDPAQVVTEYATAYAESHAAEIAADYIRYNLLTAAIKAIKDNPSDPAHTLKKISHCIGEKEKTAKVELSSGEVVTVEARAIRMITNGAISNYYVKAYDRDKLPKNEYNKPEDIQPEQIKAIYHGQRTLYRAA